MLLAGMFVTMVLVADIFAALGGEEAFGAVGMGVATAMQFIGFLGVMWVALWFARIDYRKGLALQPVDMWWMGLAVIGGLTVSLGPTWGI